VSGVFLFWRIVLGALRSRAVVALGKAALFLAGRARRDAMLNRFDSLVVRSGWPRHPPGWINLYASELRWRAARGPGIRAGRPAPRSRAAGAPWRVGFFGAFSGTLSFPRDLFAACPPEVELVVVDVPYRGARAGFVAPFCHEYIAAPTRDAAGERWTDEVAAAVNGAGLDLLVNVRDRPDALDLIDRLTVPCVANYCTGSDLLHHAGVDFQYHGQPQPDFFVRDDRMYCGLTRAPFSPRPVFAITGYYDRRGLDLRARRPRWSEREPLIVCHGSLYKLTHPAFLACLLGLLAADSALEFVMIGKDSQGALGRITGEASRRGLASRVHYEGEFSSLRDAEGHVSDSGWMRLLSLLERARLAGDPWPIGGGSSRFEAYLAGTPSAHMGVRLDPAAWGRGQAAVCDILFLNVARATAFDVAGYREIARRCLYDGEFADLVAGEQREVAVRLSDEAAWWSQLRTLYDRWARGAGHPAA
jgi:hypothetical protein